MYFLYSSSKPNQMTVCGIKSMPQCSKVLDNNILYFNCEQSPLLKKKVVHALITHDSHCLQCHRQWHQDISCASFFLPLLQDRLNCHLQLIAKPDPAESMAFSRSLQANDQGNTQVLTPCIFHRILRLQEPCNRSGICLV